MKATRLISQGLLWMCLLMPAWALADDFVCPPREGRYQPRDYLNPADRSRYLRAVESHHFDNNVRSLKGGARGVTSTLIGDLEYTLNWFPNHHLALETLTRLALREKSTRPLNATQRVECRFQAGMRVNPRDGMVPMLYASYLQSVGKSKQARQYLASAVELSPDDANVRYNAGLLLMKMNDPKAAVEHARRAYALGFPLPGLRDMLKRAGYSLAE